jgi:hypothetical protein
MALRLIRNPTVDAVVKAIAPEVFVRAYLLARYREILDQRAEIHAAFVAKYGIEPEDAVQVVERVDSETEVFYVTRKIGVRHEA